MPETHDNRKKHALAGKYVIQKNDLIYGNTSIFSLNDLKILKLIMSKVDSKESLFNKFYEIHNDELKALNLNENHLYQIVISSLKNLANTYITMDGDENGEDTVKEVGLIQNNFKYKKYSKRFIVSFHQDMEDYLLKIKKNFTRYPIIEIADLKLKYSLKLYEYLMSTNLQVFEISLEKLKKRLDIEKTSYEQFGNFKVKVLDPAIKQISETTSITVHYEPIKDGKKVVKIKFIVKKGNEIISAITTPFKKISKEKHPLLVKYLNAEILVENIKCIISHIDVETFTVTVKDDKGELYEMECGNIAELEDTLQTYISYEQ